MLIKINLQKLNHLSFQGTTRPLLEHQATMFLRASNIPTTLVSSPPPSSSSSSSFSVSALIHFSRSSSPSLSFSPLTNAYPFHKVSPFLHFTPKPFQPISPFPPLKRLPKANVTSESGSGEAVSTVSQNGSDEAAPIGPESGSKEVVIERLVEHVLLKETDGYLVPKLLQRLEEGDELAELAAEYSICHTKDGGGMIGWIQKGSLVPEFEEAVFNAPLNEVIKCKTKLGWHLLQVLGEREAGFLTHIMPAELHIKLEDPQFVEEAQLIDIREINELEKCPALPGFDVLPFSMFESWGPEIPHKLDIEKEVYVMCHHGLKSMYTAKYLYGVGFKRVFNVKGGIHAYAIYADRSVPTYVNN